MSVIKRSHHDAGVPTVDWARALAEVFTLSLPTHWYWLNAFLEICLSLTNRLIQFHKFGKKMPWKITEWIIEKI